MSLPPPRGRIRMAWSLLRCTGVCVPLVVVEHVGAAATAAEVTGGVSSTQGIVGGASGAVTGVDTMEMSPSEAAKVEARDGCSGQASRMGITMTGSMVLASNSGIVYLEVVADRFLTTLLSLKTQRSPVSELGWGHPLFKLSPAFRRPQGWMALKACSSLSP